VKEHVKNNFSKKRFTSLQCNISFKSKTKKTCILFMVLKYYENHIIIIAEENLSFKN